MHGTIVTNAPSEAFEPQMYHVRKAEASQCEGSDICIVTQIAKLVRQKPFPKFLGQLS